MFEEVKELLISILNSSFSATSEKSRNRKIIFWYDAKKDYEELLDELELEDTEIIKTIGEYSEVSDIAERMVVLANENGGKDNITLVLVKV